MDIYLTIKMKVVAPSIFIKIRNQIVVSVHHVDSVLLQIYYVKVKNFSFSGAK